MKNTFLLMSFISISFVAVAQQKHTTKAVAKPNVVTPTDPVQTSFTQQFSGNPNTSWTKTPGGNFIAQFDKDGLKQTAEFTPEGKWVRTKASLSFDQLSEAAQKAIKGKYPDAEVVSTEKILLENVPPFYKVSLKKDKDGWIVWVNDAGIIRE